MNLTIVTSEFPPSRIANARRPWLLAREMQAAGHRVCVITRPPAAAAAAVATRAGDSDGLAGIEVFRLHDPVPAWRRRWGRIRLARALIRRLWPDEGLPWMLAVARWLKRQDGTGLVLACINPASLLLLNRLVPARRNDFFYDYLESVTPFRRQVPYEHTPHRQLLGWLTRIERTALARARGVVFTSSVNRDAYADAGLVGKDRSVYIPHHCDPNPHANADLPCDGMMEIACVGYFNRDRSPEIFLKGLRRFLDREPDAAPRVRVRCHGNGLGLHRQVAADLGLEGVALDGGELEYEALLPVIARSHVLLLVAAPRHRLFYPSKAAEYIAARRPILALVAPGSEIEGILRARGRDRWLCGDEDTEAVARCLSEAWEEFRRGGLGRRLPECPEVLTPDFVTLWRQALGA